MVSNILYFHPYLGKWSNSANIFQMGWFNHQLDWYFTITTQFISNQRAGTRSWPPKRPLIFRDVRFNQLENCQTPTAGAQQKMEKKGTFSSGFPGKLLFLGGGNSNSFGIFIPTWGILTNIFQTGWNHQLLFILIIPHSICIFPSRMFFLHALIAQWTLKCSNFLLGV